jgi:pimeloyl-ACP methyl ester carboxylesterase
MTQQNSGYLQSGDGKVYYETAGEGETVVLCHAGFVDSGMWDNQWDALAQRYHVVRYDMRGYGKSDPVTEPVSRREELYKLLTHLSVKRAHLIGCSMGGETIMDFALDHPEMVASLVVVSAVPSGFEMQGAPPAELLEMMAAMQQGDLARGAELQLRLWIDGAYRQPEEVDPQVRQRAAEMNRIPVERGTSAVPNEPLNPPAAQRLGSITAPALIITGALDNPEIRRIGGVMAAEIPNARQVTIEGAAHVPNMEKAAEFNRAVLAFLEGIAE